MDIKKYFLIGMVVFLVMASLGAIAQDAAATAPATASAAEAPAAEAPAAAAAAAPAAAAPAAEKAPEPPKEYTVEKPDAQQLYYGSTKSFYKPASVNFKDIVRATPEFQVTQKKKIETGSAKYWQLVSQASERALRVIAKVGKESEYDLIVLSGYLEGLETPIETTDITDIVLKKL